MTDQSENASRPLLIYDGECELYGLGIGRWRKITGDRVAYAPYQDVADCFPEVPRERFGESVHLVEPQGHWSRGAEAVFRSLGSVPGHGIWLWLYRNLPGFAAVTEWSYRLVSRNRFKLARIPVLERDSKHHGGT